MVGILKISSGEYGKINYGWVGVGYYLLIILAILNVI